MAYGDASDKSFETRAPERTDAAEERARTEALEDRGLLSEREKQYRADIKDGKQRSGEPLNGSIGIDRDGNYIFRGNDGVTEIQRPEGTYRREYSNGAYFERNADNKVTEVHFATARASGTNTGRTGAFSSTRIKTGGPGARRTVPGTSMTTTGSAPASRSREISMWTGAATSFSGTMTEWWKPAPRMAAMCARRPTGTSGA